MMAISTKGNVLDMTMRALGKYIIINILFQLRLIKSEFLEVTVMKEIGLP